jgi:hypothetical protein
MKAMACYSPLSEVIATNVAEAENMDTMDHHIETTHIVGGGEMPGASNDDGRALSARATEDFADGGASDGELSRTYYFGVSTITLGKIKEMVKKGYFAEGEARALGVEVVLEPDHDEAIVYEDFSVVGVRMPPHPALADILLHF